MVPIDRIERRSCNERFSNRRGARAFQMQISRVRPRRIPVLLSRRFYHDGLIPTLEARGLLSQVTSESLKDEVETGPLGVYLGADPTADSLHLGNLMPLMVLIHFHLRGHRVFPLIGGATGVVGDPSGRKSERAEMVAQQRERNIELIAAQMRGILENSETVASKYIDVQQLRKQISTSGPTITPVNNNDWWKNISMLWFLGTFGRHIRVSAMLARESVKQRLSSEAGIGYSEFSYQILQAYDFYHLYKHHNCRAQIGGHDQWGNITAGIDLINRLRDPRRDPEAFGLTVPLLTTPSGEKFGKSAGNAVFLSAAHSTPYSMYQHLVQSPDEAVEKYLKVFTFIPLGEIAELMEKQGAAPEKRLAQRRLAYEVTELIHGPEQASSAQTVSAVIFGNDDSSAPEILAAFKSQGLSRAMPKTALVGKAWKDLVAELAGISKSEANRLIKNNAIYSGVERSPVKTRVVEEPQLANNGMLLVRIGKSEYHVIEAL